MAGIDALGRTFLPFPVEDSHPQKIVKDGVVKVVFPLHPEFFGSSTHVTPEAILKEALREVVIFPTLKTLERINVLFPRKDRSMPTTLGKLKKSWISKRQITRISTAPTKYAVGYGSAELMAEPT